MFLDIAGMRRACAAVSVFFISLFALLLPTAAQNAESISAVWFANHKTLQRIDLTANRTALTVLLDQETRALAVDPVDGGVWALKQKQLSRYDGNGQSVLQVDLTSLVSNLDEQKHLALDPYDASLWTAGEKVVLHVNAQGQRLGAWQLFSEIHALALDIDESLWILSHDKLVHLSRQGAVLRELDIKSRIEEPEYLVVDSLGGILWIAGNQSLIQLELNNLDQTPRAISVPGAGDSKKFLALGVDPFMGNLWAVTKQNYLLIYDRDGNLLKNVDISPSNLGEVKQLAFEPVSASFWIGGKNAVGRFSSSGDFVARVAADENIDTLGATPFILLPSLALLEPKSGSLLNNPRPPIRLGMGAACNAAPCLLPDAYTRLLALDVSLNGQPIGSLFSRSTTNEALYIAPNRLPEGLNTLIGRAVDLFGHSSNSLTGYFTIDTIPPKFLSITPADGSSVTEASVVIRGKVDDPTAVVMLQDLTTLGGEILNTDPLDFSFRVPLIPGENNFTLTAQDPARNTSSMKLRITLQNALPPDPATVASPIDPTVVSTLAATTEFLYMGTNPVQRNVTPGAIGSRRVAVLRGMVRARDDNPLSQVTIKIKGHPEYGQTLTRADGMFDMAVNGGGTLTVEYTKDGFLPVQRQINAPWRNYALLPDVVMVALDNKVTTIDLNASTPMQVAQGNRINDQDGSRQATIFFPRGTTATLVMPDGTTQMLTTLNVRATEYTVGPNGPKAMPAELPPTSGYTYAVELSADEAIAAGAKELRFSQPVPVYVDNFLNFPVGGIVPAGYYDRVKAVWIPSDNGRVIKVLGVSNGLAELDVDGSGSLAGAQALATLGITDAERAQVAVQYQAGNTLWRVPTPHFTPYDFNWPFGLPPDAKDPQQPEPQKDNPEKDPCKAVGSIIECQNQTLGEKVAIVGTPFSLHYQSDHVPGRKSGHVVKIKLSGAAVPASLRRIDLVIAIAGRSFFQSFPAAPNQSYTFTWDGIDAYGRRLVGDQKASVALGYVYPVVYQRPAPLTQSFGSLSGIPFTWNSSRAEVTLWQNSFQELEANFVETLGKGLSGWSIDVHHRYDSQGRTLYFGNGNRRGALAGANTVLTTIAGLPTDPGFRGDGGPATQAEMQYPAGMAIAADGSMYVADEYNHRVRRIAPDGIITTVAGNGSGNFSGDGGLAIQAGLKYPFGVAVAADGTLYIACSRDHRIRRVTPNGIIATVAGTGVAGFSGDGGPATQAQLNLPDSVTLGTDGSLYIADEANHRIRRVSPNGIMSTIAGTGVAGFGGDGGPATEARLYWPFSTALGSDGSLYISDFNNNRIRRISPSGIISTVAGTGERGFGGDGGLAIEAKLDIPTNVAVGPDGSIYIGDFGNFRVRVVSADGIISTIAGSGVCCAGIVDIGIPATQAWVDPNHVAVGQDGDVYSVNSNQSFIRKIFSAYPNFSVNDILISSEDGQQLYRFNANGRHLATLNAITGSVVYAFGYDAQGYLATITNGSGEITTFERDGAGKVAAIVAPDGQRTALALDPNGYLATLTNPANESFAMSYSSDGLLRSFANPRGATSRVTYDDLGRLVKDEDAAGGSWTLSRTTTTSGYEATMTSALNRSTIYRVDALPTGDRQWRNTGPDGAQTYTLFETDGSTSTTSADGTITTVVEGPDPRFGMQAPITKSITTRQPSGLTASLSTARYVSLSDPNNLLSLTAAADTITLNGKNTTVVYSAATKQYTTISPAGRQNFVTINELSQPVAAQTAGLAPFNFGYDLRGRLTSMTKGQGTDARDMTLNYNTQGFLSKIYDALGRNQSYSYDLAGRLTQQSLPDGRVIQFTYDSNGNVTSITPPSKPSHGFTYTPIDLVSQYTPPAAGIGTPVTLYTYNLDKQLTKITRPDGQTVDFGYDTGGRMSTVAVPNGTLGYAYNTSTGNLQTLTSSSDGGSLNYTYDGFLLTQETWGGAVNGAVTRTYNNDFRVTGLAVNGANIAFAYDNDGLLTQAGSETLARDPQHGLITGTTLGSVTTAQGYNPFGEITQLTATQGGSPVFDAQYTRNKLGSITQKTETVSGQIDTYVYTYDLTGRLTDVAKNGSNTAHYSYDSNSNRTGKTGASGNVIASYDDQDRLLSYGNNSYAYTDNGERKSKTLVGQTTNYVYDVYGNLRSVSLPNGTTIDYVIDGRNRRVGKKINGTLTQAWLYQGQLNPVAELDGSGSVVARFVYSSHPNAPDYMIKGGNTYRIISDHLGSPRLVINTSDGAVAQRIDYDEFGNVLQDTNPGFQPFGFAGGFYDRNTNLVRFGARDYDPEIGRWTAKDPVRFSGGDTNLYGYVVNDPVNLTDATGKFWGWVVPTVIAAGTGVYKFLDAVKAASTSAGELQDEQEKEQQRISDIMNGVPVNPICPNVREKQEDLLQKTQDILRNQPPGTLLKGPVMRPRQ